MGSAREVKERVVDQQVELNGEGEGRGIEREFRGGLRSRKEEVEAKAVDRGGMPALRQLSDPSYEVYELTKTSSLAISSQLFHSKLKTLLFKKSYPDLSTPSAPST